MSDGTFFKWIVGGIAFVMLTAWLIWVQNERYDTIYEECTAEGTHSEKYCSTLASGTFWH